MVHAQSLSVKIHAKTERNQTERKVFSQTFLTLDDLATLHGSVILTLPLSKCFVLVKSQEENEEKFLQRGRYIPSHKLS